MSEKLPTPKPEAAALTAEEIEKEEAERYEAWMAEHPVVEAPKPLAEASSESVAECEAMMATFEQEHDLDALHAITHFDSREERESSIRQPAIKALSAIFKRLKEIGNETPFSVEARETLGSQYERLSQAVGNITTDGSGKVFDKVVHDRRTPFPHEL